MSAWARIGAKCVVVDASWLPGCYITGVLPPRGTVVCIKAIIPSRTGRAPFNVVIDGYPNPEYGTGIEMGWRPARFRPAVDQSTDLAMFQRIAADAQNSIHVSEPA